jgi:hypothetical protein
MCQKIEHVVVLSAQSLPPSLADTTSNVYLKLQ